MAKNIDFILTWYDLDVGPCYYNECLNNASCIEEHGNTYKCKCEPGYYGDFCQFGKCVDLI